MSMAVIDGLLIIVLFSIRFSIPVNRYIPVPVQFVIVLFATVMFVGWFTVCGMTYRSSHMSVGIYLG